MTDNSPKRLVTTGTKRRIEALFVELEAMLDDEAAAVSTLEIDEKADIVELAVYPDMDAFDRIAEMIAVAIQQDFTVEVLPDVDWVTRSLEGLPSVRAGRFIVHGSHARESVRAGDIAIEIEAGRAFGTGHHGTTAGCLEMIDRICNRRRPRQTLDLGAGSAVLALAVAKRARTPVLATDIDSIAVDVARRNVILNGEQTRVRCETATGFNHRAFTQAAPFDLIIANILPAPLMAMAPDIRRHLEPGGDVILSGILRSQRRRVLSAFRLQDLVHKQTIVCGDWVTLHLK